MPPLEHPPRVWRSLEERDHPEPADGGDEFPLPVFDGDEPTRGISRRTVLEAGGAFAALSALGACFRQPTEEILPYSQVPEPVQPGIPLHFASSLALGGYGLGVVVESREGRPIKVEGNPLQPWSDGATSAWEQAALLELYSTLRLREATYGGKGIATDSALAQLSALGQRLRPRGGEGLAVLVEPDASPLHEWMLSRLRQSFPRARFVCWSALSTHEAERAAVQAFGERVVAIPDLDQARVIASFDADFLGWMPGRVRDARQLARHRLPELPLSRLYTLEPALTVTGMYSDHRLPLPPSKVAEAVAALASELGASLGNAELSGLTGRGPAPRLGDEERRFVQVLARDLARAKERGLVLAGPSLPAWAQALCHAINGALGAIGSSVRPVPAPMPELPSGPGALQDLADAIRSREVQALVVTAWNPVYTAPPELAFGDAVARVETTYLAMRGDETVQRATRVLPRAHALETWGDVRAPDGFVSFIQPLIYPLFGGVNEAQVFSALLGEQQATPWELLRRSWREKRPDADQSFEVWIRSGVIAGSQQPPRPVRVQVEGVRALLEEREAQAPAEGTWELAFVPGYATFDGRFGQNPWLHERPDPVTKQSWGNAARMSVATAKKLDLFDGDEIELSVDGRTLRIPMVRDPGHADGAITVSVGYGQNEIPLVRDLHFPLGSNAYVLRSARGLWSVPGATVKKTGEHHELAFRQGGSSMHEREIALVKSAHDWEAAPHAFEHLKSNPETLYDPWQYDLQTYRWGMAIDLSRCTGCTACIIACQAENNIPCVGPKYVRSNREMHWLRLDRYFIGGEENPRVVTQPLMCQHCEHAPCEYVCPVNATVHSDEGLNEMVYNRCIGTRYCSNNCPYKVRRFNFLDYHRPLEMTALDRMYQNPDVTVRARGVMEKCTYCVQRIERARIQTRIRGERIEEGGVVTACQQACPTEAIVFGNLADPNARVSKLQRDLRAYRLLNDLGTRPRTQYLVRIINPNPEMG